MLSELQSALMTKYATLPLGGGAAGSLLEAAPLTADVGKVDYGYPIVLYAIDGTDLSFSTCSDFWDVKVAFRCHDSSSSLVTVTALADSVLDGFNEAALVNLDDAQLTLRPDGMRRQYQPHGHGWMVEVSFKLLVEKYR